MKRMKKEGKKEEAKKTRGWIEEASLSQNPGSHCTLSLLVKHPTLIEVSINI
jgi:hypothetical protein